MERMGRSNKRRQGQRTSARALVLAGVSVRSPRTRSRRVRNARTNQLVVVVVAGNAHRLRQLGDASVAKKGSCQSFGPRNRESSKAVTEAPTEKREPVGPLPGAEETVGLL